MFPLSPIVPYKKKEDAIRNYYKNREMKLEYQRKWDAKNKDKKRIYDKKRYATRRYSFIQNIRHYSRKNHFNNLLEKYKHCQLGFNRCFDINKLEIHHIKYTKKIKDCLLVCQNCHKIIHRKNKNHTW